MASNESPGRIQESIVIRTKNRDVPIIAGATMDLGRVLVIAIKSFIGDGFYCRNRNRLDQLRHGMLVFQWQ